MRKNRIGPSGKLLPLGDGNNLCRHSLSGHVQTRLTSVTRCGSRLLITKSSVDQFLYALFLSLSQTLIMSFTFFSLFSDSHTSLSHLFTIICIDFFPSHWREWNTFKPLYVTLIKAKDTNEASKTIPPIDNQIMLGNSLA